MSLEDDVASVALNIDRSSGKTLYVQISTQIRQLIRDRRLTGGERIPSSRKLARLLGVSRTSTLNAYDQLIAEGLLVSRSTSGVFVTALGASCTETANRPQTATTEQETAARRHGDCFDAGPDLTCFLLRTGHAV